MNLILKNDDTGDYREVKNGPALYFLLNFIPGIGSIIVLVISILRKQFKVWLSMYIVVVISYLAMLIFYSIQVKVPTLGILYIIFVLFLFIFLIIIQVGVILNLNYWSYNKYIEEGYEVENFSDEGVEEFIEKAELKQKPFWIFFI